MPSTKQKKSVDAARVSDLMGVGGEPLGQSPTRPPGILERVPDDGVRDTLICCVDGRKGFPEAIEAIFPANTAQTYIVHHIRNSLKYVARRRYDAVVKDLKSIYTAIDPDHALQALEAFEQNGGSSCL